MDTSNEDNIPTDNFIDTIGIANRIKAELRRHKISQSVFAQVVLGRSQGTLSDLLRNPKPWVEMKSGRSTFLKMAEYLQEPENVRIYKLRDQNGDNTQMVIEQRTQVVNTMNASRDKKKRVVFNELQKKALKAIFKEFQRPNNEMKNTIAQQLSLDVSTVSNFFQNARRRHGLVRGRNSNAPINLFKSENSDSDIENNSNAIGDSTMDLSSLQGSFVTPNNKSYGSNSISTQLLQGGHPKVQLKPSQLLPMSEMNSALTSNGQVVPEAVEVVTVRSSPAVSLQSVLNRSTTLTVVKPGEPLNFSGGKTPTIHKFIPVNVVYQGPGGPQHTSTPALKGTPILRPMQQHPKPIVVTSTSAALHNFNNVAGTLQIKREKSALASALQPDQP